MSTHTKNIMTQYMSVTDGETHYNYNYNYSENF